MFTKEEVRNFLSCLKNLSLEEEVKIVSTLSRFVLKYCQHLGLAFEVYTCSLMYDQRFYMISSVTNNYPTDVSAAYILLSYNDEEFLHPELM